MSINSTSYHLGKPGKYFDEISKNIQCLSLFSNPDIDKPSKFKEAPMRIPKWLQNDYRYQNLKRIHLFTKNSTLFCLFRLGFISITFYGQEKLG